MTEQNQSERTRRTFMKGAAATGVAATGITVFSGSAAAQGGDVIRTVEATQEGGLLQVQVILQEVLTDFEIDVLIQDIEVDILNITVEDNIIILNVNVLSEQAIEQLTVLLEGTTTSDEQVTDSASTQL